MVRVDATATDQCTAWRVRDALAAHPLLAGASAQIYIRAGHDGVVLEGWARDERIVQVALRLAYRSVGRRSLQSRLHTHAMCSSVPGI